VIAWFPAADHASSQISAPFDAPMHLNSYKIESPIAAKVRRGWRQSNLQHFKHLEIRICLTLPSSDGRRALVRNRYLPERKVPSWVRRAERDQGRRPEPTPQEQERIAALCRHPSFEERDNMQKTLYRRRLIIAGSAATCLAKLVCVKAFGQTNEPVLRFRGRDYFLRQEKNETLFYFTPGDQSNMQTRTDMFSIVAYPDVKNYEQLQAQKNQVLATYHAPGSVIFNQKDAPPSPGFGGECFFVTGKGGDGYTDAYFARFTLASGIGYALIYTRSFYEHSGADGDSASALGKWINAHGSDVAKSLLDFTIVLNAAVLQGWAHSLERNAG